MNERRAYANTRIELRERKAEKIRRLLAARVDLAQAEVLDLGAGSGHISRYLQPHTKRITAADQQIGAFAVEGVDVHQTNGTSLPFRDAQFDVVVYNHVLEHVGERAAQESALAEIVRVLRPGGFVYVATPSRYAVMEPHFRLPLLSWLPQPIADSFVRASGRGTWYDCNPFTRRQLYEAMRKGGLKVEDGTIEAIQAVLEIEHSGSLTGGAMAKLPDRLLVALATMTPTLVMIGRKDS